MKTINFRLQGGADIFKEIKKFRGVKTQCSSRIDDEIGAANIASHFGTIYSSLYNKADLGDSFMNMYQEINDEVSPDSMAQVYRIDEDLVRKALSMLKDDKNDALFNFQSDCLKNGPPSLVPHLTQLLRTFLVHGVIPNFILICSLLPLVKDNLGDITQSDNYRAIASGGLLLKLLDIIILLLEGDKLGCDELQFGFQEGSSTTMCSWMVTATIDFYIQKGRPVYGCTMDLSKAFDMVDWWELFGTLRERSVEPIFLRLLLYIYRNQMCDVRWNGKHSDKFSVKNDVRQGAVSSPILFSVFIEDP